MADIRLGAERRVRLGKAGFSEALVHALDIPPGDLVARKLWASNGEVLAELPPVALEGLPEGIVVPVCHVDASSIHYILLVSENEDDPGTLWDWGEEWSEPMSGGVLAFLTETIVYAWESAGYSDEALSDDTIIAWAERVGYPNGAARELLDGLGAERPPDEHNAWLEAFTDRLAPHRDRLS